MPFVTFTVTTFMPLAQVAAVLFSTSASPTFILIVALSSVGIAVITFVAFVVVAVYSAVPELNAGESVSDPIVSPDKVASKGLQLRRSLHQQPRPYTLPA